MRRAQERAARLGFKQSFSAYIAKLIADDLTERAPITEHDHTLHDAPTPYRTKDPPPKRKAG